MKNVKNLAVLVATAVVASAAVAQTVDNWRNGTGELVWKNGTNELCWRNSAWTPATAAAGCDGAAARAPAAAPAPAPAPAPAARPAPAASKVTYAADTFFDFDKSVLKPAGKAKLDDQLARVPTTSISTRRFLARPSLVLLSATGCFSPLPSV